MCKCRRTRAVETFSLPVLFCHFRPRLATDAPLMITYTPSIDIKLPFFFTLFSTEYTQWIIIIIIVFVLLGSNRFRKSHLYIFNFFFAWMRHWWHWKTINFCHPFATPLKGADMKQKKYLIKFCWWLHIQHTIYFI